jgi:hypothetical protein
MIEELFEDIEIDEKVNAILAELWRKRGNQPEYEELLRDNPNAIILSEALSWGTSGDPEKTEQPRKFKAWNNFLKVLFIEFMTDPYWNSRLGWMMWFWTSYARYDSYYPMGWSFHYDPMNWYRHDEPMRPEGLERTMPSDPFNVKGECFVHPEWYKLKEETGKKNWNDKNATDNS